MRVTKRDGTLEDFSEDAIRQAIMEKSNGLAVDIDRLVKQCRYEIYDGIPTSEIDRAIVMIARSFLELDPDYSTLATRLMLKNIWLDVKSKDMKSFVTTQVEAGLMDERMLDFDWTVIQNALVHERDELFDYIGLEMLSSRYCMSDIQTQKPIETPQMFWMRVAMGLSLNEETQVRTETAAKFYDVMSQFYYAPGGRTLFQSGFKKAQLANCFINTVPDDLDGIFKSFNDNAQYLKWSGGTGTDWTNVRATGADIKATGVTSQGIIPFIKIANDVNVAINRSGKRRGAGCIYLESWHLDIEDFLELRKNTGDERRRAHDTNTANWIPDLFMKRVRSNGDWTLFSPEEVPDLHDKYGRAFEVAYIQYENLADEGKIKMWKRVKAPDLWRKMLAMLFETGHPWITFKDAFNVRNPQDHDGVIHSSNLCTEIGLNNNPNETAVCTLGSVNFAKMVKDGKFDEETCASVVHTAIRMLDNVIDLNFYPTEDARLGSTRHRPVGLGIRGFHDALYQLGIKFESPEALQFSTRSMEVMALNAIEASALLAKERGVYSTFKGSKWDRGIFPQDTLELLSEARNEPLRAIVEISLTGRWDEVRALVKEHGMRNSNLMAIAPTASTANLVGCIPCVEPIYQNIYVKSNKQGEFTVVNKYLMQDLKEFGLWNEDMLLAIKSANGSVQRILEIPKDIRDRHKTVFEIDQKHLIKMASLRGVWIDQSQSINIFFSGSSGSELSEIYFDAWEAGLKSTYYLRTLAATGVEKSTVSSEGSHKREEEELNVCISCES